MRHILCSDPLDTRYQVTVIEMERGRPVPIYRVFQKLDGGHMFAEMSQYMRRMRRIELKPHVRRMLP